MAIFEILKSSSRARSIIDRCEDWDALDDAMNKGSLEDVQTFEQELERVVRAGLITLDVGLRHSSHADRLKMELADLREDSNRPAG